MTWRGRHLEGDGTLFSVWRMGRHLFEDLEEMAEVLARWGGNVWRGRRVMFEEKENFEKEVVDFRVRV